MWSVGAKTSSGSRELATAFGLPGQVCCVGQEACWRSVVCRGEIAEWVKKIVGGVWSVGAKRASGSRELLAECGLSGQVCCVGQRNWRRMWSVGASLLRGSRELSARVVCRVKYGEWVKGIVGECGLSGQVWRVGQRNCRQSLVCRGEKGEWVKRPVGGFGLSGQVWRVGQENCWRSVVCRVKYGE